MKKLAMLSAAVFCFAVAAPASLRAEDVPHRVENAMDNAGNKVSDSTYDSTNSVSHTPHDQENSGDTDILSDLGNRNSPHSATDNDTTVRGDTY